MIQSISQEIEQKFLKKTNFGLVQKSWLICDQATPRLRPKRQKSWNPSPKTPARFAPGRFWAWISRFLPFWARLGVSWGTCLKFLKYICFTFQILWLFFAFIWLQASWNRWRAMQCGILTCAMLRYNCGSGATIYWARTDAWGEACLCSRHYWSGG